MSLTLITGLANAGKTGAILRDARSEVAAGESPLLVVPSLADARRLEGEFAGNTPMGIRVSTLRGFRVELWQLHGDGRRLVSGFWRESMLRRIVEGGVGAEIAEAAAAPGFIRFLSSVVIQGDDRTSTAGLASTPRPSTEIASLVSRYHAQAKLEGMVEEARLGQLLAGVRPHLQGRIGVMRFDRLELPDAEFLVALSRDNRVNVALTWEEGFAATRGNDPVVELLSGAADEHRHLPQPPREGEIRALAHQLYSGPAGLRSTRAVVAGLAAGTDAEAALVARFASREITAGVARERIAIAFPEVSKRSVWLRRALEAEGVSANISFRLNLPETRFGRALLGLLTLALGGGGRLEALAFLLSPFSGIDRQVARSRDVVWRERRVVEPKTLMADLSRIAAKAGNETPRLAEAAAQGRLTLDTLPSWQKLADALLATMWQGAQSNTVESEARTDVAAHHAVSDALAEIARQQVCDFAGRDVVAALSNSQVRVATDETEGRVEVCDFKAVGSRRFDALILGGLTEAEIPLRAGESPGDDFDIEAFGFRRSQHADNLRLEFYSLLTRARNRLYLVRQDADSEGRECRASALWEDTLDVYCVPGAELIEVAEPPIPCERITRAEIEDSAPALTIGGRDRRRLASTMLVRSPERGTISSAEGLSAISLRTTYSATEIETYLECPYRWFFERVVRPREIDSVLDARELGTHAHRILAAFYRRVMSGTDHDRVSPGWLEEALELFDQVAAVESERAMTLLGLSEELAVARAIEWGRSVVGQDALLLPDFVPREVELEFGGDSSAFIFAGSMFRGRIDRVDTSTTSVFVTDYKFSKEVPGIAAFERAAKVQAIIYASATEAILGLPVSGSVYRSLRTAQLRGFWRRDLLGEMPQGMCEADGLDAEGYSMLVERTEERVSEAIEGMRCGRIPRTPAVADACKYCALAAFCEGVSR